MPASVVITGASSGLGEALALRYANDGARLGLIGRSMSRLEDVAARCRGAGAVKVETASLDVRNFDHLNAWINDFGRSGPIDLIVANAGIIGGATSGEREPPEVSRAVFETNVTGTMNTVQAVLPDMLARGTGQIAIVSSLAGFVALPDVPSYSASKAAVTAYGLSLREALLPRGIIVSVVCPGYVDTPMARQLEGRKPFQIAPQAAAEATHRGLSRGARLVAFPWTLAIVTRIAAQLPSALVRPFTPKFRVRPLLSD